jgi:streptogramin lyase
MKALDDYTRQVTSPEWLAALPEDTIENRRLKEIFIHSCTDCHSAAFALQNRFDESGWRAILARMEVINVFGKADAPSDPIIKHYKGELAPYLARMRGPNASPMTIKPFPRPVGDAARVVVTEYDVPTADVPTEFATGDGSNWSDGIPSSAGAGDSMLHDVSVDKSGNAWASNVKNNLNRTFIEVDSRTGKATEFRLPAASPAGFAQGSHGVAVGPDGIIWIGLFADAGPFGQGSFGRVDPGTNKIDVLTPPAGRGSVGPSIYVDGKGRLWGTNQEPEVPHNETGGAVVYDPASHKFTYFKPMTPGTGGYGVAGDADGNGWFCQPGMDIVGYADYQTKEVGEIRLPPRPGMNVISTEEDRKFFEQMKFESSYVTGILPAQGPRRMAAQGNYVWWSNWYGRSLARVDIRSHQVVYYDAPYNLSPYIPALDKKGMVWVALPNDDRVAKLDPTTKQWTIYDLPSHGANTRFIAVDNFKDSVEVWTAYSMTSRIARLQFRTKEQLEALANSNPAR